MKNKLSILILGLFVFFCTIGCGYKVYAYSGLLDEYAATDVSIAGLMEIDSFTTSGHVYVQNYIDSFQLYDDYMYLTLKEHHWYGYTAVSTQEAYGPGEDDLTFALPERGTYKFEFEAGHNYNRVNFSGDVWDYR